MADQLKDILFTRESIQKFASEIQKFHSEFNSEAFFKIVFTSEWKELELKAKMHHITICLHKSLPKDFLTALDILVKIAPQIKGFEGISLPNYVEKYGQKYWDESLKALKEFTKYSSSEYGIRPFIIENQEKAMAYMLELSKDKNVHVRRFSSEGCRPRLPWAMALPALKKDPSPIFPILENLKNDASEYVRKSVANNLNDISKDHPDLVLNICKKWLGKAENTDWIIKKACRTLLKAGNPEAMSLFGYNNNKGLTVKDLSVNKNILKIGESFEFSFKLETKSISPTKIRIEYAIDFVKSGGKHSSKIFMITEKEFSNGEHLIRKKHSFADLSTRKHYPGEHKLKLIVNGTEKTAVEFQLI